MVRFFDTFFRHWFIMDPSIDLIFTDVRSRTSVMARMIAFMCQNCDKFDKPEVMQAIRRVAYAHHRAGVKPRHYDAMVEVPVCAFADAPIRLRRPRACCSR